MKQFKTIEATAICLTGPEDCHLRTLHEDGSVDIVQMKDLVPENTQMDWSWFEALTNGFGRERSQEILDYDKDRFGCSESVIHRIRITVEVEPLTKEESDRLLGKVKDRNDGLPE